MKNTPMTRSSSQKSAALIAVTAAAATLVIQACGGGAVAQEASDADVIEGVWDFSITRKDCTTSAVLGTQQALSMFQRGGPFSNDNSTPPATHGAMFGSWKRGVGAAYAVNMVFMRFNPDGTLTGNGSTFAGGSATVNSVPEPGTALLGAAALAALLYRRRVRA